MNIGNAIKVYRDKQGLTQEDLAMKLNKSTRTIQRYESGQTMPSMKVIDKIFNIRVEYILTNELLEKRGL
ncbi:helix-turn-helix transcriptional regulator [Clostridium beijerinckii]|uniref:Helix-turn-helix transcriptional regulator n=1 Tax=Clostridium beijerinckii TaxID=1520 RepID=A0A7X9SR79_CLOBE|nr:helix-turn-helix transcriptional regulator [Clostridium beijerinckii]NMF06555.1 helix-turn-helix transcriptional regulator [Clostridium beijerinckii]